MDIIQAWDALQEGHDVEIKNIGLTMTAGNWKHYNFYDFVKSLHYGVRHKCDWTHKPKEKVKKKATWIVGRNGLLEYDKCFLATLKPGATVTVEWEE